MAHAAAATPYRTFATHERTAKLESRLGVLAGVVCAIFDPNAHDERMLASAFSAHSAVSPLTGRTRRRRCSGSCPTSLTRWDVLRRLDPADRAFFAQVSHGYRAAVLASELPCAGTRVGMRQLNPADRARLAGAVWAFVPGTRYLQLGLLRALGYVASSNVPRAGGVVRVELSTFCTSAGRLALAKASGCRWNWWNVCRRRSGRAPGERCGGHGSTGACGAI
jgi:hypothetical protein